MSETINTNDLPQSTIRVGSRKSELALIQTNHVISLLRKLQPEQKFEIHKMTTMGDRILNVSLPKIGEKSLFTKDLEDALRTGVVDFVVHSLKDLPTALPDGMAIGAILEREDARDSLVLAKKHEGKNFETLPAGSIIGTSSLRRTAQLARLYPHLKVHDIRGNLNTRLAKLDADDSKYAGIVLAQAGLVRMNWHKRISHTIEPNHILYAVGQGALAVECRSSDTNMLKMLKALICHETQCSILAERSFLKTLGGGCSAPVAVHSTFTKSTTDENNFDLNIVGSVWSLDGAIEITSSKSCPITVNNKIISHKASKNDDYIEIEAKRAKLTIETVDDNFSNDEPSPPQIVDHSKASNTENVDLIGLINIHSEAFQKCPHSKSICPMPFPIGQDVMGQCPYIDQANPTNTTSITSGADVGTCPFKNLQEQNADNSNVTSDAKQCPFLKRSSETSSNDCSAVENKTNDERLFCGVYPHQCWPIEVFEQCEQLGKDLADQLIEKGALPVMERAQAEIRQKN